MDKVEYLKDQLAVLCAEVAYYQKKALAVTDDLELEMEPPSPQQRQVFLLIIVLLNSVYSVLARRSEQQHLSDLCCEH